MGEETASRLLGDGERGASRPEGPWADCVKGSPWS